jgi:hypothetical protein
MVFERQAHRVAFASVRAERALVEVVLAVVGARPQVDQVRVGVRLEPLEPRQQHPPASVLLLLHLVRAVKLLLQKLSDLKNGSEMSRLKVRSMEIIIFYENFF